MHKIVFKRTPWSPARHSLKPHRHDNRNLIGDSGGGRRGLEDSGTPLIFQLHEDLFRIDHIQGFKQISSVESNLKGGSIINHLDLFLGIPKILMRSEERRVGKECR